VGLTGKLDGQGLYKHGGRKPLNLVLVLDTSGSMHVSFSDNTTKLTVAQDSLLALMSQIKDTDTFGLITFTEVAKVVQDIGPWKDIDKEQLKKKFSI